MATKPLPPWRSPPLQSGGQKQKWPTSRPHGYQTPAALGLPAASERVAKSEVAYKWARWLHNPCRLRGSHRFVAGGKIKSGPQVGHMATKHLPPWGSQPLRSEGQNQKWPTSGQGGYITPTAYGFPSASERGGKIRSGPQVGHVATKPLPPWRSPPLQSGGQNQKWPTSRPHGYQTPAALWVPTASERGQNQKWPTSGQGGYITPAAPGVPTTLERGAKSEVAHK